MIVTDKVCKTFKSIAALRDVSFVARDGEITGLVGPNGAGKTTIMRILYTVLRADRGTVEIDGYDVTADRREVQKRIGALPDSRGLYPRLTAREQIRYYGHLYGLSGQPLEDRIDELVAVLGMEEIADRRAKGFSRGQSLKVALARALLHEPNNLLFDEPTNGLDIASSRAIRDLLRGLRDRGRCVLFCSHVVSEVAALCDRLVVLAYGRVVSQATPAELCEATGRADLEEALMIVGRSGSGGE